TTKPSRSKAATASVPVTLGSLGMDNHPARHGPSLWLDGCFRPRDVYALFFVESYGTYKGFDDICESLLFRVALTGHTRQASGHYGKPPFLFRSEVDHTAVNLSLVVAPFTFRAQDRRIIGAPSACSDFTHDRLPLSPLEPLSRVTCRSIRHPHGFLERK